MSNDIDDLKDCGQSSVVDHLVITDLETGEILVNRGGENARPIHRGGLESGNPA